MNKRQKEAEAALHDQENLLPTRQLIFVFSLLALTLLVMFIDQNGIGQILPTVAKDLHAEDTVSWAGTSALIGNTVFQVLYGRLSDIFGRKKVYLTALSLLSFTDLMCGLSRSAPTFYFFRGLAGVAGGGITSLSMMIVSDIVTLERRGKFQGILGSMVGVGNLLGPLLAAVFAQKASWRYLFYTLVPTSAVCCCICAYFLPSTMPKGEFKQNVKKIDYWGVITASIALILLLIPISGGGSYFEWKSPMVISMLTIGGIFLIVFIIVEWKVSPLPMLPMYVFKNPPVAAILVQQFFFGIIFYGYLYYLPLYYQNVRRFTPLKSAYMTIPMVVTQSIASICSGQYISRMKRYGECIVGGFILLTIATSLTTLFNRTAPIWAMVIILITMGIGNGNVFQPTIISLQAHSPKNQRAIIISVRNFIRCLGGAVGLALCAALLQGVLRSSLPPEFQYLAKSTYTKPNYSQFSAEDTEIILNAYAKASRAVFIFMAPMAACCLLTCIFVRDRGLQRAEEVQAEKERETQEQLRKESEEHGDVEKAMSSSASLPMSNLGHEQEKGKDSDLLGKLKKPAVAAIDIRV